MFISSVLWVKIYLKVIDFSFFQDVSIGCFVGGRNSVQFKCSPKFPALVNEVKSFHFQNNFFDLWWHSLMMSCREERLVFWWRIRHRNVTGGVGDVRKAQICLMAIMNDPVVNHVTECHIGTSSVSGSEGPQFKLL